jgi:hypothetical protein
MIGETKYVVTKSGGSANASGNSGSSVLSTGKYHQKQPVSANTTCSISAAKEIDTNFHRLASLSLSGPAPGDHHLVSELNSGSSVSGGHGVSNNSNHGNTNVKFIGFFENKNIDEREKYLTAKYPNHQMALIKKRLKVEFWIDEQLKNLFNIKVRYKNI